MAEEEQEESRKKGINNSSSTETASGSGNTNPTVTTTQPHDDGSGWLRLGIGCSAPHRNANHISNKHSSDHRVSPSTSTVELNLLPGGPATRPAPLFYYQAPQQQWVNQNHNSSVNGNYFRMVTPLIPNYGINPPATTSFQTQRPLGGVDPLIRLVDPPRRPISGIWFLLQPSLNQSKQPFLPQLPKNYLRIKDGRMTVRFLLKYIVNKLGLESESEVEIRCRGEQLEASLTMQHVRDEIWGSTHHSASSSPLHHLMILHYARSS